MRGGARQVSWTFARRWRVLKRRAARWFLPRVRTPHVEAHLARELDGRDVRPDGSAYEQ
jgi:hypothetical protein